MSTSGTGLVVIEFSFKVGLIEGTLEGSWKLADNWEQRKIFLTGDVLSIANLYRFVKKLNNKMKNIFSQSYLQAEVFRKALTQFIPVTGDWY